MFIILSLESKFSLLHVCNFSLNARQHMELARVYGKYHLCLESGNGYTFSSASLCMCLVGRGVIDGWGG